MREIKSFARSKILLHSRPYLDLSRIRKQILDNGSTLACFVYIKQSFARHPTVSYRFLPSLTTFTLSDNHVETIITQIQWLTGALYTITDYSNCFIF